MELEPRLERGQGCGAAFHSFSLGQFVSRRRRCGGCWEVVSGRRGLAGLRAPRMGTETRASVLRRGLQALCPRCQSAPLLPEIGVESGFWGETLLLLLFRAVKKRKKKDKKKDMSAI